MRFLRLPPLDTLPAVACLPALHPPACLPADCRSRCTFLPAIYYCTLRYTWSSCSCTCTFHFSCWVTHRFMLPNVPAPTCYLPACNTVALDMGSACLLVSLSLICLLPFAPPRYHFVYRASLDTCLLPHCWMLCHPLQILAVTATLLPALLRFAWILGCAVLACACLGSYMILFFAVLLPCGFLPERIPAAACAALLRSARLPPASLLRFWLPCACRSASAVYACHKTVGCTGTGLPPRRA